MTATESLWSRHTAKAIALAVLFVAIDQASKVLVVKSIPFGGRIPLMPGLFNLTYIANTGAAWGMLAGKGWLLLAISIAVLAGIAAFLPALSEGWPERIYALLLVCSGIAGNSIDRVFRGEVVDFLDFYLGAWHWPAFNIADSCITAGVIAFIASSIFRPEGKRGSRNGFVQYRPQ